jgi:hypothetical protein
MHNLNLRGWNCVPAFFKIRESLIPQVAEGSRYFYYSIDMDPAAFSQKVVLGRQSQQLLLFSRQAYLPWEDLELNVEMFKRMRLLSQVW